MSIVYALLSRSLFSRIVSTPKNSSAHGEGGNLKSQGGEGIRTPESLVSRRRSGCQVGQRFDPPTQHGGAGPTCSYQIECARGTDLHLCEISQTLGPLHMRLHCCPAPACPSSSEYSSRLAKMKADPNFSAAASCSELEKLVGRRINPGVSLAEQQERFPFLKDAPVEHAYAAGVKVWELN